DLGPDVVLRQQGEVHRDPGLRGEVFPRQGDEVLLSRKVHGDDVDAHASAVTIGGVAVLRVGGSETARTTRRQQQRQRRGRTDDSGPPSVPLHATAPSQLVCMDLVGTRRAVGRTYRSGVPGWTSAVEVGRLLKLLAQRQEEGLAS